MIKLYKKQLNSEVQADYPVLLTMTNKQVHLCGVVHNRVQAYWIHVVEEMKNFYVWLVLTLQTKLVLKQLCLFTILDHSLTLFQTDSKEVATKIVVQVPTTQTVDYHLQILKIFIV